MENDIVLISEINDFTFCPASIYYHHLYENVEKNLYQSEVQINGTAAHKVIDNMLGHFGNNIIASLPVYSSKYGTMGKIDVLDVKSGTLTERKNKITKIYDGQVFQLYAQYFALIEMGYTVSNIQIHSVSDNKLHRIKLPGQDLDMLSKFENTIKAMKQFDINSFEQNNIAKCSSCIYEPACGKSCLDD